MFRKTMLVVLLLINAAAVAIMCADKKSAVHHRRRVPEHTLMAFALLGGSPGVLLGMCAFRHKTRHPKFALGVPAILLAELLAAAYLLHRFPALW